MEPEFITNRRCPRIAYGLKTVVPLIQKMDEGTLILHEDIASWSRIDYGSPKYRSFIARLVEVVEREFGYLLRPVISVGYRISLAADFSEDIAAHRTRKMRSQAKRAVKSMERLRIEAVPEHRRQAAMQTAEELDRERKRLGMAERMFRRGE